MACFWEGTKVVSLDDRERILELLESYESLLTPKQKETMDAYYRYDLSLGEISSADGVTRSAVSDAVKKTAAKLEDFEAKLGLVEKKKRWKKEFDRIESLPAQSKKDAYASLLEEIIHGI